MSLIRETKLNPIPIQTGYGVPTHISPAGSQYFDFVGKKEYLNRDGIVDWISYSNSVNYITGTTYSLTIQGLLTYYGVDIASNVDLDLPDSTNYDGYVIAVKDEGGNAKNHRIRINAPYNTIENTTHVDMKINYMALQMIARNNGWWII